jgi:DNA primase
MQKTKETQTHIQVCCPYHNNGMERRPSAGIRKSDGKFHCFACNEVHDLPEVISYCLGHTDDIFGKYGMKWLLKNFANIRMEERKGVKLDMERNIGNARTYSINNSNRNSNSNVDNNGTSNQSFVSEQELSKYRYTHPYILKRGVSKKIVELFDIGWDSKLDAITFPNLDKNGNCLFVAKRSVKQKFFQYPKDVQKELYGIYQLYQLNPFPSEVYVCESMIDCLYLWTFDIPACAMNGLGNDIQFRQLRDLPCRQLVLATDMDEAGQAARKRIRMNMKNTKIIKEVVLPKGRKDINDCSANEIQNLVTVF